MSKEELKRYLDHLSSALPLDRYVERRFTAASETGGVPVDMDLHFRGMLRDREPKLGDVLEHTRVLILAEPGGGKSVIARAAVHHFTREQERVPVFAELKAYRGDLAAALQCHGSRSRSIFTVAAVPRIRARRYRRDPTGVHARSGA